MATKVTVRGNLDQALRKFKQKVARDGVPSEWKKREAYDKPGVRRRAAKKEDFIQRSALTKRCPRDLETVHKESG